MGVEADVDAPVQPAHLAGGKDDPMVKFGKAIPQCSIARGGYKLHIVGMHDLLEKGGVVDEALRRIATNLFKRCAFIDQAVVGQRDRHDRVLHRVEDLRKLLGG